MEQVKKYYHTFFSLWLCIILFFVLRFPSLFEPYWYGDEGIYQVIGKALRAGRPLYTGIWDNKPPLLYYLYATFNADQFSLRLVSLFCGIGAVACFYLLTKYLFQSRKARGISTIFFSFFFGVPLLEGNIANAENFILFPILLVMVIVFRHRDDKAPPKKLFIPGILLGIAFLFKIIALFDFATIGLFLFFQSLREEKNLLRKNTAILLREIRSLRFLFYGFLLPFCCVTLYYLYNGAFSLFFTSTFTNMVGYVGYGNNLFIPQGLLIVKTALLGSFLYFLFKKRGSISATNLFILVWTGLSLFGTFFSQRAYVHYALIMLPSLSLLTGWLFEEKKIRLTKLFFTFIIFALVILQFKLYHVKKSILYYGNFFSYMTYQKSIKAYREFFDWNTMRDYQVTNYLAKKMKPDENIFIWGNSAQLYVLNHALPPGRFTVAYHMENNKNYLNETEQALEKNPPEHIVVLQNASSYPFSLSHYNLAISIYNAEIYEKTSY